MSSSTSSSIIDSSSQSFTIEPEWQRRLDSDRWLRSHPELGLMMKDFVQSALKNRPDDCEKFAINYFVHGQKDGKIPVSANENSSPTKL